MIPIEQLLFGTGAAAVTAVAVDVVDLFLVPPSTAISYHFKKKAIQPRTAFSTG